MSTARRRFSLPKRKHTARQRRPFCLEHLENRQVLAAGGLDTSFNGTGSLLDQPTTEYDQLYAVAVNSSNQILAAGRKWTTSGGPQHRDALIAKYNADGSIDTTFGSAGKVVFSLGERPGGQRINVINDMAIDHNGRIVVAGETEVQTPTQHTIGFVARYTANGQVDTSFNGSGVAFIDGPTNSQYAHDYLNGVAIDSQNRVVALGYRYDDQSNTYIFVHRFTAAGVEDGEGIVRPGAESHSYDGEVAIDSQDRIVISGANHVVAGGAHDDGFVARFLTTLSLDSSFGTGGYRLGDTTDVYKGLALDASDGIAVTGTAYNVNNGGDDMIIARFTNAGAFDTSFHSNGRLQTEIPGHGGFGGGYGNSVAVGAGGKITVGGGASNGAVGQFGVVRVLANGSPDLSFGNSGGGILYPFREAANDMAIDSQGRIVLGGPPAGEGFQLLRLLPSNAAPVLGGISGTGSYSENYAPVRVASAATLSDADNANIAGGVLTVTIAVNASTDDRLGVRNEGAGQDQISVAGSNISFNGQVIGTSSGGSGTTPLKVNLSVNATVAATQALLRNITFQTLGDQPSTLAHTLRFQLTDGDGGASAMPARKMNVVAVNDAPALNIALNPSLGSISEDAQNPAGTLVSSLVAGISDPDAGALKGIAVTAAATTYGRWQYQLTSSGNWTDMPAISPTQALLLTPDSAKVRFLPAKDFHGTVKLWYRAWDRTQGTAGGTLNPATNSGGTKSLSTASENAPLVITAVNDAPVLALSGTSNYAHDSAAITLASGATVSDVDSTDFMGGRLRVRIGVGSGASNRLEIGGGFTVDSSNNVLQGTTIIGKRTSDGTGTRELIVTFTAAANPTVVRDLVRAITFRTVGGSSGQRNVIFTVSDGDGGLSAEQTKVVNVT